MEPPPPHFVQANGQKRLKEVAEQYARVQEIQQKSAAANQRSLDLIEKSRITLERSYRLLDRYRQDPEVVAQKDNNQED
jgi:hypothetical protein